MLTKSIHWDDNTHPLQARQLKEYVYKEISQKNPYDAAQSAFIMSPPTSISLSLMAGLLPAGASTGFELTSKRIKYFRVKFITGQNKRMAATDCIPDFQALSLTNDVFIVRNKLQNLPICVAIDADPGLKVGDQITVRTTKSDLDPDVPSMQMCTFVEVENSPVMFDNESEGAKISRSFDFLFGGQTTTLEDLQVSDAEALGRDRSVVVSTKFNITWQQALQLSQTPAYKKLGKWIKASEGTYESVIGQLTGWKDPVTNKKITEMTVSEVYTAMHGSIRTLRRNSNAVGA